MSCKAANYPNFCKKSPKFSRVFFWNISRWGRELSGRFVEMLGVWWADPSDSIGWLYPKFFTFVCQPKCWFMVFLLPGFPDHVRPSLGHHRTHHILVHEQHGEGWNSGAVPPWCFRFPPGGEFPFKSLLIKGFSNPLCLVGSQGERADIPILYKLL